MGSIPSAVGYQDSESEAPKPEAPSAEAPSAEAPSAEAPALGLRAAAPSEPRFTKACGSYLAWRQLDTASRVERLATALRILVTEGGSKAPFPPEYLD